MSLIRRRFLLQNIIRRSRNMGLFGDKDAIVGAALGAGGAFDKNQKTDKAKVMGAAMGASLVSGKKWTVEDTIKLNAAIRHMDAKKK